jgi:hypothetical protein
MIVLLDVAACPSKCQRSEAAAPRPASGLHRVGSRVTGSGRLLRAQIMVTSMYPMATLIAIL